MDKQAGLFLFWIFKDFGRSSLFIDQPFIHVEDAAGHASGKIHFMRDDRHRHSFPGQAADDRQHFADHRGVQCGSRFVEQDDFGVHGQTPGDGDPLFLAAGEFIRKVVGFFSEAHQI